MLVAIFIDAMHTVVTPKPELTRYKIRQQLIKKHLGREADLAELEQTYGEKRKQWEHILPPNHGEKWATIDREILLALFPGISYADAAHFGKLISDEILTNADFYEITADARKFLAAARKFGIKVIITSNQDREKLEALLQGFGVLDLFYALYTSTEIGVEKPDPKFFHAIVRAENVHPSDCVMVGNNPDNDVSGAESAGITGILFDPDNRYKNFLGRRLVRLSDIWIPEALNNETL